MRMVTDSHRRIRGGVVVPTVVEVHFVYDENRVAGLKSQIATSSDRDTHEHLIQSQFQTSRQGFE